MRKPICPYGHDKRIVGQDRYRCCKECVRERSRKWNENNRKRSCEKTRRWQIANPEKVRKLKRKQRAAKYGMSLEQFDAAIKSRNSRCDICVLVGDLTPKKLCQDHDKITGQNRGMLCNRHNLGIGYLNHSPAELMAACEYMKKHSQLKLVG